MSTHPLSTKAYLNISSSTSGDYIKIPYTTTCSSPHTNLFSLGYAYGNQKLVSQEEESGLPEPKTQEDFLRHLIDTEFERFAASSCKEFCALHHIAFAWPNLNPESKYWWYRRAMGLV